MVEVLSGTATLEVLGDGKAVVLPNRAALPRTLAAGHTIRLSNSELVSPSIARICRQFADLLGAVHVRANLYVALFSEQPATDLHKDETDALVIQLAGEKRWQLEEVDAIPREHATKVGECLFIPRSAAHRAFPASEDICVSVTFRAHVPSKVELAHHWVDVAYGGGRNNPAGGEPLSTASVPWDAVEADFRFRQWRWAADMRYDPQLQIIAQLDRSSSRRIVRTSLPVRFNQASVETPYERITTPSRADEMGLRRILSRDWSGSVAELYIPRCPQRDSVVDWLISVAAWSD